LLDTVSDIARIAQAFISIALLTGVGIAFYSWKSKQNLDRRSSALSYSLTKNEKYFNSRGEIAVRFKDRFKLQQEIDAVEIQRLIENGDPIVSHIKFVLSHWEVMAISIFEHITDQDTCFEMVGSTLVDTVDVLMPYIQIARQLPENRRRYDYLLILHDIWKSRLQVEAQGGFISSYERFVRGGRNTADIFRPLQHDRLGRSTTQRH